MTIIQSDREAAAKVRPYSHNSALILGGQGDGTDIVQAAMHSRLLILSDLAENPPQCAVDAMTVTICDDRQEAVNLPPWAAKAAFTAAINAIREAK